MRLRDGAQTTGLASTLALVLSVLLASGCTMVGPDFAKPDAPVAASWSDADGTKLIGEPPDDAEWWTAFGDPVLDQLVETAYRQNLPIRIAGIRVLEARAQLGIAAGNLYPQRQQAGFDALYRRTSDNAAGTAGLDESFWTYDLGLSAAWEIDFWGRFRRGIESADANFLASIADYDSLLVSLTAEVATAYLLVRTFEERLAIARHNVEVQQQSLRIADVRYRNGATTELDVQQARTLLYNTQASIPPLSAGLRQAENGLSILLGRPPGNVRALLGGDGLIPAPPARVAIGIPADLLRRRPDVRAAELQAAAQSALIGVAASEFYPQVVLLGSIGLQSSSGSSSTRSGNSSFGDLFSGDSLAFVGGPSVTWNIFNYGRIANNVRVQDARLQQLLVNYQERVLRAAAEVENASIAFLRAQEQAALLGDSVTAAQRSVDLSLLQYRDGAADYTRVLDSQRALAAQQDQLTATRGAIAQNLVAIYRALGGGWQIRAGYEFVPEEIREQMMERTDWGDIIEPGGNEIPPRDTPEDGWRYPDW